MNNIKDGSVFCYNHQGKGSAYVKALNDAGFRNVAASQAQIILIDIDNPGRVNTLIPKLKTGASRLFIYPHAARPGIAWDGLFPSSPYTTAQFVAADGHVDILRAYGYSKPLHVAGWSYSPIESFKPCEKPHKILFAPIHPTRSGFLSKLDKDINAATFSRLLKLAKNGDIVLTVRYIRGIEGNGLTKERYVTYIEGKTNLNFEHARRADLVVGHQTYAYTSVALGIPTLMMSEDTPPRNGGSEDTFKFVSSWEKYRDILMYPLDILAVDDTLGLIRAAGRSDEMIMDWRRRIIGKEFCPSQVVEAVKSYL